jgi:hypothetical protein
MSASELWAQRRGTILLAVAAVVVAGGLYVLSAGGSEPASTPTSTGTALAGPVTGSTEKGDADDKKKAGASATKGRSSRTQVRGAGRDDGQNAEASPAQPPPGTADQSADDSSANAHVPEQPPPATEAEPSQTNPEDVPPQPPSTGPVDHSPDEPPHNGTETSADDHGTETSGADHGAPSVDGSDERPGK